MAPATCSAFIRFHARRRPGPAALVILLSLLSACDRATGAGPERQQTPPPNPFRHGSDDRSTSPTANPSPRPNAIYYDANGNRVPRVDSWRYPIRLGDTRAAVHQRLGIPARYTGIVEDYPHSGVSVSFDPEGHVSKFFFVADADLVWGGLGLEWIQSDDDIVFGISMRLKNEEDFVRLLGPSIREFDFSQPLQPYHDIEVLRRLRKRRIWRTGGYVIDATFLRSEESDGAKTFRAGSLMELEISPGL